MSLLQPQLKAPDAKLSDRIFQEIMSTSSAKHNLLKRSANSAKSANSDLSFQVTPKSSAKSKSSRSCSNRIIDKDREWSGPVKLNKPLLLKGQRSTRDFQQTLNASPVPLINQGFRNRSLSNMPGRRSIMNKDTGITCKNLPFWSKSIQVQRLQSEMEAVEDSRTLKRTSEMIQHRLEHLYLLTGVTKPLQHRYLVNEDELHLLKEMTEENKSLQENLREIYEDAIITLNCDALKVDDASRILGNGEPKKYDSDTYNLHRFKKTVAKFKANHPEHLQHNVSLQNSLVEVNNDTTKYYADEHSKCQLNNLLYENFASRRYKKSNCCKQGNLQGVYEKNVQEDIQGIRVSNERKVRHGDPELAEQETLHEDPELAEQETLHGDLELAEQETLHGDSELAEQEILHGDPELAEQKVLHEDSEMDVIKIVTVANGIILRASGSGLVEIAEGESVGGSSEILSDGTKQNIAIHRKHLYQLPGHDIQSGLVGTHSEETDTLDFESPLSLTSLRVACCHYGTVAGEKLGIADHRNDVLCPESLYDSPLADMDHLIPYGTTKSLTLNETYLQNSCSSADIPESEEQNMDFQFIMFDGLQAKVCSAEYKTGIDGIRTCFMYDKCKKEMTTQSSVQLASDNNNSMNHTDSLPGDLPKPSKSESDRESILTDSPTLSDHSILHRLSPDAISLNADLDSEIEENVFRWQSIPAFSNCFSKRYGDVLNCCDSHHHSTDDTRQVSSAKSTKTRCSQTVRGQHLFSKNKRGKNAEPLASKARTISPNHTLLANLYKQYARENDNSHCEKNAAHEAISSASKQYNNKSKCRSLHASKQYNNKSNSNQLYASKQFGSATKSNIPCEIMSGTSLAINKSNMLKKPSDADRFFVKRDTHLTSSVDVRVLAQRYASKEFSSASKSNIPCEIMSGTSLAINKSNMFKKPSDADRFFVKRDTHLTSSVDVRVLAQRYASKEFGSASKSNIPCEIMSGTSLAINKSSMFKKPSHVERFFAKHDTHLTSSVDVQVLAQKYADAMLCLRRCLSFESLSVTNVLKKGDVHVNHTLHKRISTTRSHAMRRSKSEACIHHDLLLAQGTVISGTLKSTDEGQNHYYRNKSVHSVESDGLHDHKTQINCKEFTQENRSSQKIASQVNQHNLSEQSSLGVIQIKQKGVNCEMEQPRMYSRAAAYCIPHQDLIISSCRMERKKRNRKDSENKMRSNRAETTSAPAVHGSAQCKMNPNCRNVKLAVCPYPLGNARTSESHISFDPTCHFKMTNDNLKMSTYLSSNSAMEEEDNTAETPQVNFVPVNSIDSALSEGIHDTSEEFAKELILPSESNHIYFYSNSPQSLQRGVRGRGIGISMANNQDCQRAPLKSSSMTFLPQETKSGGVKEEYHQTYHSPPLFVHNIPMWQHSRSRTCCQQKGKKYSTVVPSNSFTFSDYESIWDAISSRWLEPLPIPESYSASLEFASGFDAQNPFAESHTAQTGIQDTTTNYKPVFQHTVNRHQFTCIAPLAREPCDVGPVKNEELHCNDSFTGDLDECNPFTLDRPTSAKIQLAFIGEEKGMANTIGERIRGKRVTPENNLKEKKTSRLKSLNQNVCLPQDPCCSAINFSSLTSSSKSNITDCTPQDFLRAMAYIDLATRQNRQHLSVQGHGMHSVLKTLGKRVNFEDLTKRQHDKVNKASKKSAQPAEKYTYDPKRGIVKMAFYGNN